MFIELHLLQSFGPSCLNRDDTNAPKDCHFGGCRRARISSQCLKRAIRFHPALSDVLEAGLGLRTRRLTLEIVRRLQEQGYDGEWLPAVAQAVVDTLVALCGPDGRTRVLVHLGPDEVERLVELIIEHWDTLVDAWEATATRPGRRTARRESHSAAPTGPLAQACKTLAAHFKPATHAVDVALFGRMIAENAHFNVRAACQVAHALSTHRLQLEVDYFTALDDLKPGEQPGADMIGLNEFHSSCFYRYCLLSLTQLQDNLGGNSNLARQAMRAFLQAAISAVPSGRQASMAAHSPPGLVLAVVRRGGAAWSLVNAFENPVPLSSTDPQGLQQRSQAELAAYWSRLQTMYGAESILAQPACWLDDCGLPHLDAHRVVSVAQLLTQVETSLLHHWGDERWPSAC
jgi:CRISPR system Cascade subunit CasC